MRHFFKLFKNKLTIDVVLETNIRVTQVVRQPGRFQRRTAPLEVILQFLDILPDALFPEGPCL